MRIARQSGKRIYSIVVEGYREGNPRQRALFGERSLAIIPTPTVRIELKSQSHVIRNQRPSANVGIAIAQTTKPATFPANCNAIAASRKRIVKIACLIAITNENTDRSRTDRTARIAHGVASNPTNIGNIVPRSNRNGVNSGTNRTEPAMQTIPTTATPHAIASRKPDCIRLLSFRAASVSPTTKSPTSRRSG